MSYRLDASRSDGLCQLPFMLRGQNLAADILAGPPHFGKKIFPAVPVENDFGRNRFRAQVAHYERVNHGRRVRVPVEYLHYTVLEGGYSVLARRHQSVPRIKAERYSCDQWAGLSVRRTH